jgi:hypothetical protein
MCGRHEIAELLLVRGADANGLVYACCDSICMAADEKMTSVFRNHVARLTVETVDDPKTAQAILDGTVTAYSLGDAEPLKLKGAAELLLGGSDPEFVRVCLPHIARKPDDLWWYGVLTRATSPLSLKLILEHGVDPDVPDGGGCTTLHHLASGYRKWSESHLIRATMPLDATRR